MKMPLSFGLTKYVVFICLLWACEYCLPCAHAQSHLFQYRALTPADGLAGSSVSSIEQDNEGFIWLATSEGIQQYDGYRFRTFTKATNGLRAYNYQRLLNVGGRIWAIKWQVSYLIDIIDPLTRQVRPFEAVFPNAPFAKEDITRLSAGPQQSVFLTTKNGAIYHFDGQFRQLGSQNQAYQNASILCPNDSAVWLIYDQNWCEVLYGSGLVKRCDTIDIPVGMAVHSVSGGFFMTAIKKTTAYKRLWYKKWGQRPSAEYRAPNDSVADLSQYYTMLKDRRSRFWFYGRRKIDVMEFASGRKVARIDLLNIVEKTGHEIDYNTIARTYFDSNNLAWIPTNKGVLIVSVTDNQFQPFLNGRNMSARGMVALDDHRIVAATYKGLKLIDLDQPDIWTDLPGPQYTSIGILYEAPNLWMVTHEYSLLRFDLKNSHFHRYLFPKNDNRNVFYAGLCCFRDSRKRLWVGTEKGLLWFDEQRDTLSEWAPFNALFPSGDLPLDVRQFVEDGEGMWIVTSQGLYLRPAATDTVKSIDVFSDQNLYHLYIDSGGIFWLATRNDGVIRWDRQSNNTTRFTTAQGLSNNTVYAIYEDKNGFLWMSTNGGLNVFDKKNQTVRVYSTRNGLTNNEFNYASHLRMPDGRLLFGGIDGVIAFYPEKLETKPHSDTPMQIWEIHRSNPATGRLTDLLGELKEKGMLRIPFSENNLYVEFSLLDLFDPSSNRYAYLLEGISPEWHNMRESYLRLNSLPYGSYKLRIRGFGNISEASVKEIVIPIEVAAPFYLKPLFWIVIALLIVGLFRLRTNQLRRAKAQLERQVQERTAHIEAQKAELEKLNATKDQLFAILGHELRSPVMQLQDFSEKVDFLVKKGETERLKTLSDHFGQTIANVREILENLLSWGKIQSGRQPFRPQQFELQLVTSDIFRQTSQLAELKNIVFETREAARLYLFADPNAVGIILRNLLHNAMKFTPPGGKVLFTAWQSGSHQVSVEISDTGIGMNEDLLTQINAGRPLESRPGTGGERGTGLGLSVCRDLAAQNRIHFEVSGKPGEGTSILLQFPGAESESFP